MAKPSAKSNGTSGSASSAEGNEAAIKRIVKLEAKLNADPSDPNPLLPVLQLARHPAGDVVHKAVWTLYRMFILLIGQRRVAELESTRREDTDVVKVWAKERLDEYIEILAGLLRDKVDSMRVSGLKLLFALLPAYSTAISGGSRKVIHTQLVRRIIAATLNPVPSYRGAKPRDSSSASSSSDSSPWTIDPTKQVDLEEGILPADISDMVVNEYWAKYDDLRWAFFREASRMLQSGEVKLSRPDNILSQLLRLDNLPRKQADINTFFVPLFNEPPASGDTASAKSAKKSKKGVKGDKEVDTAPSWMDYYDESGSDQDDAAPSAAQGGSKKRKLARTSHLSIHASIYSVTAHTVAYTALWEAVLSSVPLDSQWTQKILIALHGSKGILSYIKEERRVRMADWLGGLVDQGGSAAWMAMNGLFVLMTKFNMEYPNFYRRLYALLDADVLHSKFKGRFLRLLDIFLGSSLLSAALVAAFIKRLSRRGLAAPPAGVIAIIPIIYNLFKRHPGCMVMLQRLADEDDERYEDPYNPDEVNPASSKAIDSSCWELAAFQKHYHVTTATLSKIFSEAFTKQTLNAEDFLDHGYQTMFDTEMKRKVLKAPALAMELEMEGAAGPDGTSIFPTASTPEEARAMGDTVTQLWVF